MRLLFACLLIAYPFSWVWGLTSYLQAIDVIEKAVDVLPDLSQSVAVIVVSLGAQLVVLWFIFYLFRGLLAEGYKILRGLGRKMNLIANKMDKLIEVDARIHKDIEAFMRREERN